ncbi:hypothetical protein QBC44DRAFT_50572 [Cladorrhinum sp. PSN332]|nr:hypothetical protein QBC44DRAFT_50572 [Cladorrhinum sp. PSN332]
MENSAPKRRRTSPRTSVPVVPVVPEQPHRPSYASPTRTSLGRHNPEILQRRENQPRRSSPDVAPRAATPDSTGGLSQALKTQLELRSVARDPTIRDPNIQGGEGSQSQQNADEGTVLKSPARRLNAKRATSQPLPPGDENPFARRGLRRSPLGSVPQVIAPEEPELPPTPERPDPVVSTPPSGIHNTPSRRPKRNRALAEKIKSSSPLKQPPIRQEDEAQFDAPPEFKLPKKGQAAPSPPTAPEPTTAELRGLKPIDPDADKKKLRDSLLAEIAALERDLALASTENERIRQGHLSKQTPTTPPNQTEILDLLIRRALPPSAQKKEEPPPTTDWLSSALNPISFLPFNKPGTSLPSLFSPSPTSEEEKPIISHHPIPMTAEESLPFLQIFTPLTFSSTVFPLPNTQPLLQQHSITASSASPRGLFAARIEMTVNTKTLGITELSVPKLDPNATAELTPFVHKIIRKDESGIPSSGLYNNVSVLTWGMAEWLRVSVQRAKVWNVLEREVNDKERLRGMVRNTRERKSRRRGRRKRKRRDNDDEDKEDGDEDEDDDDDDDDDDAEEDDNKRYEARELLPHMGRTCLDLEVPGLDESQEGEVTKLRVVWKIHFDWTGEARSELGVLVGVPGKWLKHDERGQLSGMPRLFDELVQGGEEPLSAVRTVVSLLCGELRN